MSRCISEIARSGLPMIAGVAVGTASTAVGRSFIGESRERSEVMLLLGDQAASGGKLRETDAFATLARFTRFECGLDSGMEKELVRATVKVASQKEQRRERGACIQFSFGGPRKEARKSSCWTRYCRRAATPAAPPLSCWVPRNSYKVFFRSCVTTKFGNERIV